jgi:hypothetical protein
MEEKAIVEVSSQEITPEEEKTPVQVIDEMQRSINTLAFEMERMSSRFDSLTDNLEKLVGGLEKDREARRGPSPFQTFCKECRKVHWKVETVEDVIPELLERLISHGNLSLAKEAASYMKNRYEAKIEVSDTLIYRFFYKRGSAGFVRDESGRLISETECYSKGIPLEDIKQVGVMAHRHHKLFVGEREVAKWNRSGYVKDGESHRGPHDGAYAAVRVVLDAFGLKDKPFPYPGME